MNIGFSSFIPSLTIFGFLASFSCYYTSIPDSMATTNISIKVIEHTDSGDGNIFSSLSRNFELTLDNIQTSGEKNSTETATVNDNNAQG